MKKNITILIGVIVLFVVLFGGYKIMRKYSIKPVPVVTSELRMKSFSGNVLRPYLTDNKLAYSFDVPDYASSSTSSDGDMVRISSSTSTYAVVYFSRDGGRGLTPSSYISEIIAPHVSVINETGTSTVGAYEWQLADTAGSNWHITTINNGKWVVAIESKKVWGEEASKLVKSFRVE